MNAPLSTCVTLPGISSYKKQGEEQREDTWRNHCCKHYNFDKRHLATNQKSQPAPKRINIKKLTRKIESNCWKAKGSNLENYEKEVI